MNLITTSRQKGLRMAVGREKRVPWWNQDVKKAIQAKKDACKALLRSKSSSNLQSHISRRKKLQLWQ